MSVQLNRASVQKLTHESAEIRLRTLQQIEAKLQRALAHNEIIDFKPGELCKQLIRWFGFQPLQAPAKVLEFLARLLRSNYGDKAIAQLGVERFCREMAKVQLLLKGRNEELHVTEEIQLLLRDYQRRNDVDEIIEIMDTMRITETEKSEQEGQSFDHIQRQEIDFEVPWSKPTVADFNAMKFMADILVNPDAASVELQNALQHLQITMQDYPAEYMLQPPHIYSNLLQLYEQAVELNCPLEDVTRTFLVFLKILKERLQMRRKCLAYATTGSDVRPRTQLKIEKTLQLLLEKSLNQLQMQILEFSSETTYILETILSTLEIYRMLNYCVDSACLRKLARMADRLKECCEQDEHFTLQRIKYLLAAFLLQDMAASNAVRISLQDVELLEPTLRDYTLRANYPQREQSLRTLLCRVDSTLEPKYDILKKYENSFATAVELLKSPKNAKSCDVIHCSEHICLVLDQLKSLQLTELLFNSVVDCNALYQSNVELKMQATSLLLQLLRLSHEPLKICVYQKLAHTIKKHFGCLMNGESFCAGVPNSKLLAAVIIGVPLTSSLLLQLINASQECENKEIKQYCEDILTLLLKSQHLLGPHWITFCEVLLPVLPLLQCCTFSPKLMQLLLKLYDPDAPNLPYISLLQGNIGFLFHPDERMRSEALTRLIYMLNALGDSSEYVPNIMEISDLIPNDICALKVPRDYARIFVASEAFNELSTLQNLFAILETPDIEPIIRKTTLMQVNVMCQSWEMTAAFCGEGAIFLALQALENSLRKMSFADYTDAAIPAIGILSKVLFYDASARQELVETPNIYVLLLRALFLYQNDIQVRQDACICLFQLTFSNYLMVPGPNVEVPSVLGNLLLPVRCELRNHSRVNRKNSQMSTIFSNRLEEEAFLRQFIAASCCGGHDKITHRFFETQKHHDYCHSLHLTQRDWRLMKATLPQQNLRRVLRAMANATEHRALINAAATLKWQLLLHDFGAQVPDEIAVDLFAMLGKYLQLPPGNEMDFLLYEELLDLCDFCIRLPLPAVIVGISNTLQSDFQHGLIALLKNSEIPLRLYYKLCRLLAHLLYSPISFKGSSATDVSIFYSNLFDLLFDVMRILFEQRDLQRVRCLLPVLRLLSGQHLDMHDKHLYYYCKRFVQHSLALKSFTQTGAQWQRDCLHIICQLCAQMHEPQLTFKLNASILKYMSGLCGHNDAQVRALAWCILAHVARFRDAADQQERGMPATGTEALINELGYLPGGFMACCLSTLLDYNEVVEVRQLAGNLFVELLSTLSNFEEALGLLEQHTFFRTANDALRLCMLDELLTKDFYFETAPNLITCEIVSCYCRICIQMVQLQTSFLSELCEKAFMYKLYELLKMPPVHSNRSYYTMCADICQLYSMCYGQNFAFLQRTICRDQIWLLSFCQLLDQPRAEESDLVKVLQLLLALCKDAAAYQCLCEKFAAAPELIVKLFIRAFNIPHINTALQRCALAVLSILLIKSHPEQSNDEFPSFVSILENPIEVIQPIGKGENADFGRHTNKENESNATNSNSKVSTSTKKKVPTPQKKPKETDNLKALSTGTVAEYVFIDLQRLFFHFYPTKSCKFGSAPSSVKMQISETLAVLLKLSPKAQEAAKNLKLFDKLLCIFKTFLEEFNTSCTTFVRRYGETKKMYIVKNFQLLFNVALNWFSAPSAVLTDERQACELVKVLTQIWPWLAHSGELKLNVLQVCAFLSERSFVVCQQFSALISSYPNSILQLVTKIVTFETTKVKASSSENFPIVATGLRIAMNCCSCAEGRVSLVKSHTLDIFDGLHPFNLKSPKIKLEILHSWLQFWELFSRYGEGAQARSLNSLCAVINRSPVCCATRILSLKILRNMCFLPNNRSSLMTSTDFIYTINQVIAHPMDPDAEDASYEEQLLVSVAVWKLISGGVKFVAMIRGTKLAKKFRILREQLTALSEEDGRKLKQLPFARDLANVLDVIMCIFND